MSARRKLTDDQIAYIRKVAGVRRRIIARLKKIPTNDQLAARFEVSPRLIDRHTTCAEGEVPRVTDSSRYALRITDEEFEQLMRAE